MPVVCIVDDNPDVLSIFSKVLGKAGYTVLTAEGGHECMKVAESGKPDLILLDIIMEPMDGWQTLLRLRRQPETMKIPVFMITGKRPSDRELDRYREHFQGYIMKPISNAALVAEIDRAVGNHSCPGV